MTTFIHYQQTKGYEHICSFGNDGRGGTVDATPGATAVASGGKRDTHAAGDVTVTATVTATA